MDVNTIIFLVIIVVFMFLMHRGGGGCCGGGHSHGKKEGKGKEEEKGGHNHERIHSSLEASRAALEQPGQEANHHAENQIESVKHVHSDGKEHSQIRTEAPVQEDHPQHGEEHMHAK